MLSLTAESICEGRRRFILATHGGKREIEQRRYGRGEEVLADP